MVHKDGKKITTRLDTTADEILYDLIQARISRKGRWSIMKYPKLEEPCKSCLGCQRLEDVNFKGDKNCEYAKTSIKQINEILGIQERIINKEW